MALWEEPPTAEPWDGPAVPDESGVDEPEPCEFCGDGPCTNGCAEPNGEED